MIDKKIKQNKDCNGCHACFNICPKGSITMESDMEGFLYPKVKYNLCIKCNKCINVCPTINKIKIKENNSTSYSCINKDEKIRLESSSGGIFTLLAEKVISEGGIVFGAAFNNKFEVEHIWIDSKINLSKLRGSKYVQSKVGNSYRQVEEYLKEGKKVLFSGTPCQIGGLKSYLGKNYDNLLCIDIICHGVPSPKAWKKYLQYRENKAKSKTKEISFRSKDEGWKKYSVVFTFKDNTVYRQNLHYDLYMRAFLKDICLRPSCHDCKFKGLNRQSDITLADFWGVNKIIPKMDDDKGTSLVITNTNFGKKIFKIISHKMYFSKVNIDKAVSNNSAAVKSVNINVKREDFFNELNKFPFDVLVKKYCNDKLHIKIKKNIKKPLKWILSKINVIKI